MANARRDFDLGSRWSIGASAAAAAAAGSHAFSFSGPDLETYLTQTGVGRISILEIGSALVACLLAGLAWVTLKKTSASDLLLLSAAFAWCLSPAIRPRSIPDGLGLPPPSRTGSP